MVIAHNISAINTYKSLGMAGGSVNKAMEKLASGFRINKAADDAAGLSISEKMRSQIRGLNQASENAENGISLIQTAEGALNEVHSILQRMRELAVQSATDTNAQEDRDALQGELEQLINEVDRIGNTTEFNGIKLFESKEPPIHVSSSDLTTVKNKIDSVLSSYNLAGSPTSSAGSNGKFTFDLTNSLSVGNKITIGGTEKILSNTDSYITMNDSKVKYLYDKNQNLVYEHLTLAPVGVGGINGAFTGHLTDDTKNQFVKDLNKSFNSIEEIVASGKYVTYTADISQRLKQNTGYYNTEYTNVGTTDRPEYIAKTVDGQEVRFTDSLNDNNHWITDKTIYDDDGYIWKPGAVYDNLTYINGKNYFNYDLETKKFGISGPDTGDAVKGNISLKGIESAVTADLFTKQTDNVQKISDAYELITNKIQTEVEGLGITDEDGNVLEVAIKKSGTGIFEIRLTPEGVEPEENNLAFHVGANSNQVISVTLNGMSAKSLYIDELDITTRTNSNTAIDTIDDAIKDVSNMRSTFGAIQNRLEYTINNLNTTGENMTAAESTIRDVDMADQMMEYTKSNILQQAAQAMLIQANSRPQQALQLLRV